jgi:hypothetical protein
LLEGCPSGREVNEIYMLIIGGNICFQHICKPHQLIFFIWGY